MKYTLTLLTMVSFLCAALGGAGCGASQSSSQRTTLESIRAQFPQIEEQPVEPLEALETPPRESPNEESSFSQRVLRGESVPFSGLLLSDSAAAFVASEYEAQAQRFSLTLQQQRQRDYARLVRDSEGFRLRLNGDRQRFLIIAEAQERYIQGLETAIRSQDEPNILEILALVGVGALGVLIGIVIGIFAGI